MAENSKISWTRHTFNAWIGCTKLSPACDHCYAASMSAFRGWAKWGPGEERKMTSAANWRKPLQWNKAAEAAGQRHTVFCNSLADVFDAEVTNDWRAKLAGLITDTPHLEWLLLTKRHNVALKELGNMAAFTRNIRIGFTIENQPMADLRLPALRALADRGFPTFVSFGPALGLVDWMPWMTGANAGTIGWLVAEAESGGHARPSHPDWFRAARDACAAGNVPFHLKQNGEWVEYRQVGADAWGFTNERKGARYGNLWRDGVALFNGKSFETGYPFNTEITGPCMVRVGTSRSGRMLDGMLHDAFPRSMERQR